MSSHLVFFLFKVGHSKPGSVWPRSRNRLLPQSLNKRSSWQASPSYWRWWLAQLASWRLYWGAEPGPGGVAGAEALPGQGGQAGGAGELVEACAALRNMWRRLRPHLRPGQCFSWCPWSRRASSCRSPSSRNGCSSLLEAFLTIPLLFSLQN